jgi:RNA polymerase sigma-70 factor (ECF subfamily)
VKVAIKLRHGRRAPGSHLQSSHEDFRLLLRQHQSMVFSIARRIVRDPSLAEEVAQDVFFQLYGALPSLASEEHVVHWLRRVTVHRAIDEARRRLRRPQDHAAISFADPGLADPGVAEPAVAALDSDPWMAERLRQKIASLPIMPRTVIVLRYQEELGPEEIAELLGMPVATVKSHLQRALKVLRARMQQRPIRGGAQRPAN